MSNNLLKKVFLALITLSCLSVTAQITSNKGGDIEYGDKKIVNTEKYDGSSTTKPKFRLINNNNDTLVLVSFKKYFDDSWLVFNFKKQGKIIEVNYGDVVTGLNYQKNLGSFVVKNNLIDTLGNLNDTAFATLVAKYNVNLTEKFKTLNEGNLLMANTKFDFNCDGNKLFVNGKHVGFASLPDNQQVEFKNVQFFDINNKLIASGDLGFFAGKNLKTFDNKIVLVGVPPRTLNCNDKMVSAIGILRELFRNGYYRS